MKKQFVPYGLAVKLKELGFDEPCMATISNIEAIHIKGNRRLPSGAMCTQEVNAPLWQQAFDWFREKYRYSSIIPFNGSEHYYWWITECNPFGLDINSIDTHDFTTYEEARQACLEKLIELITKKD